MASPWAAIAEKSSTTIIAVGVRLVILSARPLAFRRGVLRFERAQYIFQLAQRLFNQHIELCHIIFCGVTAQAAAARHQW